MHAFRNIDSKLTGIVSHPVTLPATENRPTSCWTVLYAFSNSLRLALSSAFHHCCIPSHPPVATRQVKTSCIASSVLILCNCTFPTRPSPRCCTPLLSDAHVYYLFPVFTATKELNSPSWAMLFTDTEGTKHQDTERRTITTRYVLAEFLYDKMRNQRCPAVVLLHVRPPRMPVARVALGVGCACHRR